MDVVEHHAAYVHIIKQYGLASKAEEIADYLTKHERVSTEEFAKQFSLKEKDAEVFLRFIERGVRFREATRQDQ